MYSVQELFNQINTHFLSLKKQFGSYLRDILQFAFLTLDLDFDIGILGD